MSFLKRNPLEIDDLFREFLNYLHPFDIVESKLWNLSKFHCSITLSPSVFSYVACINNSQRWMKNSSSFQLNLNYLELCYVFYHKINNVKKYLNLSSNLPDHSIIKSSIQQTIVNETKPNYTSILSVANLVTKLKQIAIKQNIDKKTEMICFLFINIYINVISYNILFKLDSMLVNDDYNKLDKIKLNVRICK